MTSGSDRGSWDVRSVVAVLAIPAMLAAIILYSALAARAERKARSVPVAPPIEQCDDDSYRNTDGDCVPRPEHTPVPPVGATARCRDGTYSFSRSRSGTCSHHGGVAAWR